MTATQTPVPLFGLGTENTAYAKYFVGNSWLNMLTTDSWFAHIALELPADGKSTEWCEVVSDAEYAELP